MGILVPEAYGGVGADYVAYALAIEEIARVDAGTAVTLSVHSMICAAIGKLGSESQKRAVAAAACGAAMRSRALRSPNPDAGSDAAQIRATAQRDGDGYVLNGRKQWCTNGSYSASSWRCFAPASRGAKGMSAFLIDRQAPGVHVERVTEKLGIHTSNTCDLAFDDVHVVRRRCSARRATDSALR